MQEKDTINYGDFADLSLLQATGSIVAIDPGTKRIGVAVCDEDRIVCRPLPHIQRASWKNLLTDIKLSLEEFDAKALVIGLPLESDGRESAMSAEAWEMARKFNLSLSIPVFLQDERVTSYEAKARLWEQGVKRQETRQFVDSEAAVIILSDFLARAKDFEAQPLQHRFRS